MQQKYIKSFSSLAEKIFDEIFEDYAQSSEMWLDFEEYRTRELQRMRPILHSHDQRLLRLIFDVHYDECSDGK